MSGSLPGFDDVEEIRASRAEWLGLWPGTVVDTEDPTKNGLIRVRVPQVFGDPTESEFVQDTMIPWARPAFPTHDLHVPEVGDGVWVSFYGGLAWNPIWHGQFLGSGDAPTEFTSSYTPTPKTRIIRTANGHIIEMRWVDGEEKIRVVTAGGSEFNMKDADAEGGPLIEMATLGGYKFSLDEKQQLIRAETPTQNIEILDASGTINVNAVTNVNVNAGTQVTVTSPAVDVLGTGLVTYKGAPCLLGADGVRDKLVMEKFFLKYNTHSHISAIPGIPSGLPIDAATLLPKLGIPGADSTINTLAS